MVGCIMKLQSISRSLAKDLGRLSFDAPVTHVYNPLQYAWEPYRQYLSRYGAAPKEVILLGMNPGPWGMAQTGVPFGEVTLVREWLEIEGPVGAPERLHPKRPVLGFACVRREVSGKRLWGWAQKQFGTPGRFFSRFFVANYCPLMFFNASGTNITPNQLKVADRKPLLAACDRALAQTVEELQPRYVVGIGKFAYERALAALKGRDAVIGCVTHPSPANPKANRGWEKAAVRELEDIGITV